METFALIPGEERLQHITIDRQRREVGDPYDPEQFGNGMHDVPERVAKQFLFLWKGTSPPSRFFFDMKARRESNSSRSGREGDASCVQHFAKLVKRYGFDDPALITLLHDVGPLLDDGCHPMSLDIANNYIDERIELFREYDELGKWYHATNGFFHCLASISASMHRCREALESHPLFAQIDAMIARAKLMESIVKDAAVNPTERQMTVFVPEHAQELVGEKTISVDTLNPFIAKRKLLKQAGLEPSAEHLVTLGVLLRYAHAMYRKDRETYGSAPTVLPRGKRGLELEMDAFAHPIIDQRSVHLDQLEQFGLPSNRTWDIRQRLDHWLDRGDRNNVCVWKYAISLDDLRKKLKGAEGVTEECIQYLYQTATQSSFRPFEHVRIDDERRLCILTGANGDGKSTMMKAVGINLLKAHTGRKVPAARLTTTCCDGVFHDFDVQDNLEQGVSKFRAQVCKIVHFLDSATPHSLGLFDELYHGTNSAYQLALAWATLQEFARRKLRAIISTHEQQLTLAAAETGFDAIAGIRHVPALPSVLGTGGVAGVYNMSLKPGFALEDGSVTNSDAFKIAEEEGLPKALLERAREVYAHITRRVD